ncbi:hypothetical protein BKA70DRAFT_1429679 [Coprinopsis sp. MPI-PUGE-AT-0042]|nr:hypothetical protein BKA70DRAFT_1429679 [Coprinopsis sp. MPI-PUGE-AT-0042]
MSRQVVCKSWAERSISLKGISTTTTTSIITHHFSSPITTSQGGATEGTGPCFDEWEEFREWMSVQGVLKTMWGSGMPGAGKTIFAGGSPEQKQSKRPICVGYIYFRYSDHTTATVRDFLLVLVKQTIERHVDCLPIFEQAFARHIREKTLPAESELVQLLSRFLDVIEATFYFLDALDEAPPDVQFDLLKKLSTLNIKVFITSRHLPNLDSYFPGAHRFSIRAQDRDLELHIAKEIERNPALRTILNQGGPSLRNKIMSTVKEKCEGMWVPTRFAPVGCPPVLRKHPRCCEKTLEEFPRQIEDRLSATWKRIEAQARKRLLCKERAHMDTHKFDRNRLVDEATLMALCRGLVSVEEETDIVRFVHYTAKDVVKRLISESSPFPDSLPALIYEGPLKAALKAETLLAYAHESWSIHTHKSLDDTTVSSQLSHFILGCCAFPVGINGLFKYDILEPIHMAAHFDFPLSFAGSTHLHDPNHPTPHMRRTPLLLAIMNNSLSAVRELLSLPGILVNAADKDGYTPARYALININAPDSGGITALMRASSEEEVALLLAHPKIKPNQVDYDGQTALMFASRRGSLEVVQVLLADPRVQVNLKSEVGKTALDIAEERRWGDDWPYDEIIELLCTRSNRGHFPFLGPLRDLLRHALPVVQQE